MKNSSLRTCLSFVLLCLIGSLPWPTQAVAQSPIPADQILFQVSLGLMLTENYREAEDGLAKLAAEDPKNNAVITNRGVNLAMWGLSLLKEKEALKLIKYVFPLEVKPNSGKRGNIIDEERFITELFELAEAQFEQAVALDITDAGGYLNLASVQAIRSRWLNDPSMLRKAFDHSKAALGKAPDASTTKGNCLIIQGIIYDYLGNSKRRDERFDLVQRQYQTSPDPNLVSLAQRNQAIAGGQPAVFVNTSGEKYSVFEDDPESIDGISLRQLMSNGNLSGITEITSLEDAKLYGKDEKESTLYIYHKNENRYVLFHQTREAYQGKSSKGIGIGDNEAHVRQEYGTPVRVRPAAGGKFLFYKKAKVLFFIGDNGQVQYWMVWRGKGG